MDGRLIVGALSCAVYADRRHACQETWVPALEAAGVDVVFLLGDPGLAQEWQREGRILRLRCGDGYYDLPVKSRLFARWATLDAGFDCLFKCDDDTYINTPRFASIDIWGLEYSGVPMWLDGDPEGVYASGGCGYFLSRAAAGWVARHEPDHWAEDVSVGNALRAAGIDLTPRHDMVNLSSDQSLDQFKPGCLPVTVHLQRRPPDDMRRLHQILSRV